MWLDAGRVEAEGDPKRVVGAYLTAVEEGEQELMAATTAKAVGAVEEAVETTAAPASPPDMFKAAEGRWGSREVEIAQVALLDRSGEPSFVFHTGEALHVRLKVRAHHETDDFAFGIGLFNADGVCCYGTNTYVEEMSPERLSGDADVTFAIDSLDLVEGTYKLDVAVHKRDGFPYDYHRLLYTFRVKSRTKDVGIYRPQHRWTFSPNVRFTR